MLKVIEIALNEVGYLEKSRTAYSRNPSIVFQKTDGAGKDNITKYAYEVDKLNWYNGAKQGYAWCAVFVDYCLIKAYGVNTANKMKNHGIYDASCTWAVNSYRKAGQFYRSPAVGDQVFFGDSSGTPCHTGIVVDIDNTYIYTVEGNTSTAEGVVANGGGVCRKRYKRNYSRIYGFGRPVYNEDQEKEKTEEDDYMTRAEILKELGDTWITTYNDLPEWAKPPIRKLLDDGIINGGTDAAVDPDDINMFLSDIKSIIVMQRLLEQR